MASEKKTFEATIKRDARGWLIDVDNVRVGVANSLGEASLLLLKKGYKTYAYRYTPKDNIPGWRATVIKAKTEE